MSCSMNRDAAAAGSPRVGVEGAASVLAVGVDGGVPVRVDLLSWVALNGSVAARPGLEAVDVDVSVGGVDCSSGRGVRLHPVARVRMRSAAARLRMKRYSSCEWSLRTFGIPLSHHVSA